MSWKSGLFLTVNDNLVLHNTCMCRNVPRQPIAYLNNKTYVKTHADIAHTGRINGKLNCTVQTNN